MFQIMGAFGSLAALLHYRIGKLCNQKTDIRELRLLNNTMNGKLSELRRDEEGGKYYELKFLV